MSKRITVSELHIVVRVINRRLEKHGYSHRIGIEPSGNLIHATMLDENRTIQQAISPDLRTGLLHQWLTAYWQGLSLGLMESD